MEREADNPIDELAGALDSSGAEDPLNPDLSEAFARGRGEAPALDPVLPQQVFVFPPAAARRRSKAEPASIGAPSVDGSHASFVDSAGQRISARDRRRASDPDLPELGAIIDKYRIEDLVGTGGFAVVYRATHLLLQRTVALKLLRPKVIRKNPGLAELLCEEARFAAKINHPNVVRVLDVTHSPRITYVVMEFIQGCTLSQAVKTRGRLPPNDVLSLGLDVTGGLRAGLEQGLIHRDIKPANILLSTTGEVKIVDLGLAQPSAEGPLATAGQRFRRMAVVGTPGYMAPEQLLHPGQVDFRADIYSLGVTLYHAAVGSPPFPTNDPVRANAMHLNDPIPPPQQRVPELPAEVAQLLLWMLQKNPADRPPSYEALEAELKRVREALQR